MTTGPMVVVDGSKLRTARVHAALSQAALAARANVSRPAVHRMEHGGRGGCRPYTLGAVADALGVRPADLLPDDADTTAPAACPTCGATTAEVTP